MHADDLVPAFVAAPFPGKLDHAFIGFGTAVGKEDAAIEAAFGDLCSQLRLEFVHIKIRHVDQLARSGVRFTNAYAPACSCSPSRAWTRPAA